MYVFIDDSGDPGFKFDKGSSRFFVIACCVFETAEAAESASIAISALKERLGRPQHVEFKFAKTRVDTQVQFFDALSQEDFFVRILVIDKMSGERAYRDLSQGSLYNLAIHQVLASARGVLSGARVTIDGGGSRNYRRSTVGVIRGDLGSSNPGAIHSISFAQSHRDPLLQLADMVAGSARQSAEEFGHQLSQHGLLARILRRNLSDIALST
jgi:hypothetical protein